MTDNLSKCKAVDSVSCLVYTNTTWGEGGEIPVG